MKKTLILSAIIATLSGCAIFQEEVVIPEGQIVYGVDNFKNKTFNITHLNGEFNKREKSTVDFSDNKIAGRGFCNLFQGDFNSPKINTLSIDNAIFSTKFCVGVNMDLDRDLRHIFEKDMIISESPVGYKLSNSNGSFQLMEVIKE